MPFLLTTSSIVMCPHGGMASLFSSNSDSTIAGSPILLIMDQLPIAGCPFLIAGVPSPCVLVKWLSGTVIAKHRLSPMVFMASSGLCLNAASAPQGPPILSNPSICDAI